VIGIVRGRRRGGCAYAAGVLHGRERKQQRLLVLLDDARGSRGGSLVVRGQPEVGKSALLTDMVNRADHRTDPNRATPGEAGLASTVG